MNGIEFQQKLNRKNEMYQKNIQDNNRSNQSQLDNVRKTADLKIKSQSEAHKNQLNKVNKEFETNLDRISTDQKKSLAEKSRQFELAIDENQNEAAKIREENIGKWRTKISDIKSEFERNSAEKDISSQQGREALKRNFDENVENIRKTASKDLESYIESVNQKNSGDAGQFRKDRETLQRAHEANKKSYVQDQLRKKNFFQKTAAADIQDYREKQEKEFLKSRDLNKLRFEKIAQNSDKRIDEEITSRERGLDQKHTESIQKYNQAFTDRYRNLEEQYNKDVRNMSARHRAEMISNGTRSKSLLKKQRDLERESFEEKQTAVIKERNNLAKDFEKKLSQNTSSYQEKMQDMRIDFAGNLADTKTRFSETNARDKLLNRHAKEKLAYDHKIELAYQTDKAKSQSESQQQIAKQKINNLKQDYNRSMSMAVDKSQKDLESAREEMIFEKRILQKRLHEQNSKQNSYLKKVYANKIENLTSGYEKRIAELENKVEQVKDNASYWVKDVVTNMSAEMQREKAILQNELETEVNNSKRLIAEKESRHQKEKSQAEALYNKRMNEQSLSSHRKLKDVQRAADQKLKNESAKYQDIISQNTKYFNRELERLSLASKTERDRIISQYEEQIVQLKRAAKDREDGLKEFNKLNA